MGGRLIACADENPRLEVIARVDRDHEVGHVASSDVIIDFSLPDATDRLLKCMDGNSAALVSA